MRVRNLGTLDVGVVVIKCCGRGVLLVVVEVPQDLRLGECVDTGNELINGALEEGVGDGVRNRVGGVGVDDT